MTFQNLYGVQTEERIRMDEQNESRPDVRFENSPDERYSPAHWFEAFDGEFDLDPCAPVGWQFLDSYMVPAKNHFTINDDGLAQEWTGFVFMNPPFGGRDEIVPWLKKFVEHGNGIGVCWGRTASGWFQDWMQKMDSLLFVRNKRQFVMPDGTPCGCPKDGVVLYGIGERACDALRNSGLGVFARVEI